MCLDLPSEIITEQSRLYRLWTNNKIKSREMTSGIFALREIRASVEAKGPEPEVQSPTSIHIVSVPPGHVYANGAFQPMPSRTIEHEANLALELPRESEFEPQTERERRLLEELESLSPEQLLERARQAGYVDVDGS